MNILCVCVCYVILQWHFAHVCTSVRAFVAHMRMSLSPDIVVCDVCVVMCLVSMVTGLVTSPRETHDDARKEML